jgi:hypothetical protein
VRFEVIRETIDDRLSSFSSPALAANAVGNNEKLAKRGRCAADAVLILSACAAGVVLGANRQDQR